MKRKASHLTQAQAQHETSHIEQPKGSVHRWINNGVLFGPKRNIPKQAQHGTPHSEQHNEGSSQKQRGNSKAKPVATPDPREALCPQFAEQIRRLKWNEQSEAVFRNTIPCDFSENSRFGTFKRQVERFSDNPMDLTAFICGLSYNCKQGNLGNFNAIIRQVPKILRTKWQICDSVACLAKQNIVDASHAEEVSDVLAFKFPKFADFPAEIRYMIWKFSMSRDRVLEYDEHEPGDETSPCFFEARDKNYEPACVEARKMASEFFTLDHDTSFNYERDTFYLQLLLGTVGMFHNIWRPRMPFDTHRVQYMALHLTDLYILDRGDEALDHFLSLIDMFPQLRQLTIVISEDHKTIWNKDFNYSRVPEIHYFRDALEPDYHRGSQINSTPDVVLDDVNRALDNAQNSRGRDSRHWAWRDIPFRFVVAFEANYAFSFCCGLPGELCSCTFELAV